MFRFALIFISGCFFNSSYSQVYEIKFENFLNFNAGRERNFDEIIKSENYQSQEKHEGLTKYIFDLENKIVHRYMGDLIAKSAEITSYEIKDNLVFMNVSDRESSTGNTVMTTMMFNKNPEDKENPYFLMYFVSTVTNTTNGTIVWK
jgi:hypothetical protein